jgi:hypothetical protein
MLHVALVRTDVAEEFSVSKALSSSETSVLTRATPRNISEDAILHSSRRENLKSYVISKGFAKALTEVVPDGISGDKARPKHKADNPNAIYEPTVYTMWGPRHFTTLQAPRTVTEIPLLFMMLMISQPSVVWGGVLTVVLSVEFSG